MSLFLLKNGLMTLSPGGDGIDGDADLDNDDDVNGDDDKGSDDDGDKKVDEGTARKKRGLDSYKARNWKRKTADELGKQGEEIAALRTSVEKLLGKLDSKPTENNQSIVDDTTKDEKTVDTDKILRPLLDRIDGLEQKFESKVSALVNDLNVKDLSLQRREVLAEVGVSAGFLSSFKDGIVTIKDELWDAGPDALVDALTRMGAFPIEATNGSQKADDSGSRKSVARRGDLAEGIGSIQADGERSVAQNDSIAKVNKEIYAEIDKLVKDTGGLGSGGLASILDKVDRLEKNLDSVSNQ